MNEISYILTLLTAVFLFTQPQLAYALVSPGDQEPEKKPEEKPWEKLLMFKRAEAVRHLPIQTSAKPP